MQNKTKSQISPELIALIEMMAENVHNTWMQTRLAEGWKLGDYRNDVLKTHPSIIPYDKLPEEEKEYDRNTALETIKFIINNGYKIVKI